MRHTKYLLLSVAAMLLAACAAQPQLENVIAIDVEAIKSDPGAISGYRYVSTGQPDAELLALAKDAGVVAIVDLRAASESRGIDEVAAVNAAGMRYVAVPVADPSDVTYENAAILDRALQAFDGPVLLHCASGNRVGALFALQARTDGASVEEAMALGERAGLTRYRSVVRERLEELEPREP